MADNERKGRMLATLHAGRGRATAGATRRGVVRGLAMAVALAVGACSGTKPVGGEDPEVGVAADGSRDPAAGSAALPSEAELGPIGKHSFREHPAGVVARSR